MVNYLLDTHALIWLYFEEERIPQRLFEEFAKPSTKVFVSAISFWKISIKFQSGRLNLGNQSPEDLLNACKKTILLLKILALNLHQLFIT
jgi:PIN domain nuclease of toxin-antitoxin system